MRDSKTLLIELGTEELPARRLLTLSDDFNKAFRAQLTTAKLSFSDGKEGYKNLCTPRRLALSIKQLDVTQPDQLIERKGPTQASAFDRQGNPTQAAVGFARACGVEVSQLTLDADESRLIFRKRHAGLQTIELLPQLLENTVKELALPKRMRWNQTAAEFIRPVRWLLFIFGGETVTANLFGMKAGNITYGHRFHAPQPIVVKQASEYEALLQEASVLVDFEKRRDTIQQQATTLAKKVHGRPFLDKALVDEITGLVEWPHALLGKFDKKFLEVQKEVLTATMQDHQKYIPLFNEKISEKNPAELLARFIVISNIESTSPDTVTRGNEKVIVPRFKDAIFFWQRDKSQPLEARLETLKNIVFEKRLGNLYDKTQRLIKLCEFLSDYTGAPKEHAREAARLSKCDLPTEMVNEFPKLQGIIGRQLALHDNLKDEIATAIEEQYLPLHARDRRLPTTANGVTLALADRLDILIGIFASGKKPTGLKDPYGLRRASLAVLRIIIETEHPQAQKGLDVDLYASLQQAAALFPASLQADGVVEEVFDYIIERLRGYFAERGIAADVIESVLANHPTAPKDINARIDALCSFRRSPEAENLTAASKRIRNILKKETPDKTNSIQKELLKEEAETALYTALQTLAGDVEKHFQRHQYKQALQELAGLRRPVDTFFDDVMVMDKDERLKTNRIALLTKIDALFTRVADLSRLQS